MEFDFSFEHTAGQRGAYRTSLPGLSILLKNGASYHVKDLSIGGLGFEKRVEDVFEPQQRFSANLIISSRLYIADIIVKIIRTTSAGLVACAFSDVTRQQELRLDKLILEMQKRLIANHKLNKE